MANKPSIKQYSQAETFKLKPLAFCVKAMITGGFFMGTLPPVLANPAVNTLPTFDASTWTTNHVTEQTVGNTMTVTQKDQDALLNWQTFDVGSHAKVQFVQPNENSVVVNEITASSNPSQIFGQISANGEVFLINPNGIVFGSGSVVDTHGLTASTLLPTAEAIAGIMNPGTAQTLTGIANPNNLDSNSSLSASFTADGSSASTAGNTQGSSYTGSKQATGVSIDVQKNATVTSEGGKPILMFAPTINNEGKVSASGGQVLMAASTDVVYLQEAPTTGAQSDVRGLLVAVGTGGNVNNALNASISANQGNVTLMGFALNQQGRVSATTTINENGTIRLLATEGINNTTNAAGFTQLGSASTTRSDGTKSSVTLDTQSTTEILPEVITQSGAETKVVASQAITPSRVEITGEKVDMLGANLNGVQTGAQILAPAGIVNVTATENPLAVMTGTGVNGSAITVDNGVLIDVSGMNSTLAMASNVISVKLQSNELADSPVQKTGPLDGQTVQVDIRADNGKGTPLANISSELASLTYTLAQRLATGGAINFNSEGSVNVASGAHLKFNGGVENYLGGYIDTTNLIGVNGQLINIGNASPLMSYSGIYGQITTTDAKWNVSETYVSTSTQGIGLYQPGYKQGADAGTVAITAGSVQLNGTLEGKASNGIYQRSLGTEANGGTLSINDTYGNADQAIVFDTLGAQNSGQGNSTAMVLPASILNDSGIQKASFGTNGAIDIAVGNTLKLLPASALSLQGGSIDVIGSIQGAGAAVKLATVYDQTLVDSNGKLKYDGHINVANSATIGLQGQWVNDFTNSDNISSGALIASNGGSFTANAQGNLTLAAGSTVNVNGGAWQQVNRTLVAGNAGNISLTAAIPGQSGENLVITGAQLQGYGINKGGSLALESNAFNIGGTAPTVSGSLQPTQLDGNFFANGGFANYTVTADLNGLSVAANTSINLQQHNIQLNSNYFGAPSADSLAGITTIATLPANLIQPSSLTLGAYQNVAANAASNLSVGSGSSITATPASTITLSTDSALNFDGAITNHGGNVAMNITIPSAVAAVYNPTQGLWLGSQANIDVSGTVISQPNNQGLNEGTVLDGGNVKLAAALGFVATATGSNINVSGTSASLNVPVVNSSNSTGFSQQTIGSNGGAVNISAAEGVYLDGSMQAKGGENASGVAIAGVAGGSLSVSLQNGSGSNATNPQLIMVQNTVPPSEQKITPTSPAVPLSEISAGGVFQQADVLTKANNFTAFGSAQPTALNGIGIIGAKQVSDAGFSSLSLQAKANNSQNNNAVGEILFQGNADVNNGRVDLALSNALTLDAPVIGWALNSGGTSAHIQDLTNTTAGSVNLTAATATIGSSVINPQLIAALPTAVGGQGQLNVTAGTLDSLGNVQQAGMIVLQGEASTSGFGGVNLAASSDIQLQGILNKSYSNTGATDSFLGKFDTYSQLTLNAERIYPTTLSQFTLTTDSANGVVNFKSPNSQTPAPVLEADAALAVNAATINQSGHLLVPFGNINFVATDQIVFGINSLTSVSGQQQIIPFGTTSAGQDWLYPINDSTTLGSMNLIVGGTQASIPVPEKQIILNAPTVAKSSNSVIDLSGGGDLMAYEFLPGAGGSKDVLAAGNSIFGGTAFAIVPVDAGAKVPSYYAGYAPYDPMLTPAAGTSTAQGGLTVGEQITIGSGSALPAGTYTLLPAHYALLTGAYLVTPLASNTAVTQGSSSKLADGTPVVSGYYDTLGTSIQSQTPTNFAVQPGTDALKYSQINQTYGNSFFAAQATANNVALPLLAQDAGQLSATVTTALDLPTLRTSGVKGARVDISASELKVVKSKDNTGGVQLLASDLNAENIGSLFLGGSRTVDAATGNTVLNVSANTLNIGTGVSLDKVSELILAAQNTLEVNATAALSTQGSSGTAANTVLETSGDSAVLRMATGEQVSLDRSASSGVTGNLLIDKGASLVASNGSILLDATGNASNLQGSFNFGSAGGGNLSIGANALNIGNTDGQSGLIGMTLDNAQLKAMGSLASLYLTGRNYVDVYNDVNTPTIQNVVINTPVLAGMAVTGAVNNSAAINANKLTLANYAAGSCASGLSGCTGTGNGTLTFSAANLTLDTTSSSASSGSFAISGFDAVSIAASNAVTGKGAGQYNIAAKTTINTPEISGNSAANTTINTAGYALTIDPAIGSSASTANSAAGVGAVLNLNAATLDLNSNLIYKGGAVNLNATSGNLNLAANALIDVSATKQSAGLNGVVQIPAGEISLSSGQDVLAASGSQLLLSASAAGVSAGKLNINAPQGYATLGGSIKAAGPDKAHGGQLIMDVQSLDTASFNGLNTLATTAGFTGDFSLRLGNGDIVVDNTQTVNAQNISLAADNGAINIYGALDASGSNGGSISLASDSSILLGTGSALKAYATAANGNGGNVQLSAVSQVAADNNGSTLAPGTISMQKGSSIDVHSKGDYALVNCVTLGTCGSLGKVEFLVDQQTANSIGDVLKGTINMNPVNSGSASLGFDATETVPLVTAVKVYDLTQNGVSDVRNQITAKDLTTFNNDATTFMNSVAVNANYTVQPGIEVITTGGAALTVNPGSVGWNLAGWRYAYGTESVAGHLILRSAGDLNVQQNISDGFTTLTGKAGKVVVNIPELQQGNSWSYDLVAGADLSAANHQALQQTAANLNLTASKYIRTGTGDINIDVSGNVNMSDNSQIYSAGRQDPNNQWGYTQAQMLSNYGAYSQYYAEYPVDGGNVAVNALGNVNVSLVKSTDVLGFYTDWLVRAGNGSSIPTSWGINFAKYNDNLGALGGGNVTVTAGGNINNLTVAIPTTGKINPVNNGQNTTPIVSGGGNLDVVAGGNINGGAYYVEQGAADITAGGSLTAGNYYSANGNAYLNPILALGNAQINVLAALNISLESIVNPMITPSSVSYGKHQDSLFFTYGANSATTLTSLAGDVTLVNNPTSLSSGTDIAPAVSTELNTYPGTLAVNALQGNLNILGNFQLYPTANGNLELYAYNNIDTGTNAASIIAVILSAADPASLPSISSPYQVSYKAPLTQTVINGLTQYNNINAYAQTPVHLQDSNPALISTQVGSIESQGSLLFALSKQTMVSSGYDIINTGFMIQNDTTTSSSLISAGKDIIYNTLRDPATAALSPAGGDQVIQVSGPGQLTVLTGGNINMGSSSGIVSVGNTGVNTYLPSGGANLTVMPGVAAGSIYATDFAQNFLTDSATSSNYDAAFAAALQKALAQSSAVATPSSVQSVVTAAQVSAEAALSAKGLAVTNGYKEYITQYLLDYWNHYSGSLAVDGVMALLNQAESTALAAQTLTANGTVVVNQYVTNFDQYMQSALTAFKGTLQISGLESMMSQADSSAVTALTTQGFSSTDLALANSYKTAFNQDMQGYFSPYGVDQAAATAVAGVLSSQAATAAQLAFDQMQLAYTAQLTQLVQAYYPEQVVNSSNALSYLNQLGSAQRSLVETQLLPYVQAVYSADMKQYAEQRAGAVLTVDKDSQELNMLATTESLFRGSTLVAPAYNKTFTYDATKGWVPSTGYTDGDIIKTADINLLNAIAAYQTANNVSQPGVISMGSGNSIDIASAIQSIQSAANSGVGKALISSIYAARPDLQAAIRPVSGNLSLFFSTIQTLNGGDINLFTPNGGINAGLSASTLGQKSADQLGIIVRGSGAINAFLRDDFQVNLTRVMTLGGGDVVAGSSEGSIDAGKGVALNGAVQKQVSYDVYGNPLVSFLPAVTTSGIRSAVPQGSGIKAGTIVLFAPRGVIDAGEAGIAGGNLFLDASSFKNVANISSSTGVSVGAPSAPPAGISAALSGSSGLTASINKSFENDTNVAQDTSEKMAKQNATLGVLTVELLGFGE
jgi:filamentous hemagglutinin family protein